MLEFTVSLIIIIKIIIIIIIITITIIGKWSFFQET